MELKPGAGTQKFKPDTFSSGRQLETSPAEKTLGMNKWQKTVSKHMPLQLQQLSQPCINPVYAKK